MQGICPEGWHLPNSAEWGRVTNLGAQAIRSGLNIWPLNTEEKLANNNARFCALPSGGYFFSYSTSYGSNMLGVRIGYFDQSAKAWWWTSSFIKASYTSASSAAIAQVNIPGYVTVDNNNVITVGTSGGNSIFYGRTEYLGNQAQGTVDAGSKYNATVAIENNFYFGVRCVKD